VAKNKSSLKLSLIIAIFMFAFFVALAVYHMPEKEVPKLNTDFKKFQHYEQGAKDFASYLKIDDEKLNQFYKKVDELIIKHNNKR
jgi:flagellar basal body-associated protein FliL